MQAKDVRPVFATETGVLVKARDGVSLFPQMNVCSGQPNKTANNSSMLVLSVLQSSLQDKEGASIPTWCYLAMYPCMFNFRSPYTWKTTESRMFSKTYVSKAFHISIQ